MKGLKCFMAAVMDSASNSHGNHATWCLRSLELKKPARRRRSWQVTYKVAPRPRRVTEPSVTIQYGGCFGAYYNLSSRQVEVTPGKGIKYTRPVSDKLLWGVATTIKIVGEFCSASLLEEVTKDMTN